MINHTLRLSLFVLLAALLAGPALAQRDVDFIVALVNSEPVTRNEVLNKQRRLLAQMKEQGINPPAPADFFKQSLDRLIEERAIVHFANNTGIVVSDDQVQEALLTIAQQNQLANVAALQKRYEEEGADWGEYRREIRQELIILQARDREINSRVRVSEAEIDAALREQKLGTKTNETLNIAQILLSLPDSPTPADVAQMQAKAQTLLAQLRQGEDFAKLALAHSSATDKSNGGAMGLRASTRYPSLFVDAVRSLPIGGYAAPLQSDAGIHILKLLEHQTQLVILENFTRVRHILLPLGSTANEAQAQAQLNAIKARIDSRQLSFEAAAKEFSTDGSAAQGGELGWASPGMFVPEFEKVMAALPVGVVSAPFTSRFGVHVMEVLERRQEALPEAQIRAKIRNSVRDKKAVEAADLWINETRGRAFIEYRQTTGV
jgi:peptidyl-prolyl cis-trans isomerase SurA